MKTINLSELFALTNEQNLPDFRNSLITMHTKKSFTFFGNLISLVFKAKWLFGKELKYNHSQILMYFKNKWFVLEVHENGNCHQEVDDKLKQKILATKPTIIIHGKISDKQKRQIFDSYQKQPPKNIFISLYWKCRCTFMRGGYPLYRAIACTETDDGNESNKTDDKVNSFLDRIAAKERMIYKSKNKQVEYCIEGVIIHGFINTGLCNLLPEDFIDILLDEGKKINIREGLELEYDQYDDLIRLGAGEINPPEFVEYHINDSKFEVFELVISY